MNSLARQRGRSRALVVVIQIVAGALAGAFGSWLAFLALTWSTKYVQPSFFTAFVGPPLTSTVAATTVFILRKNRRIFAVAAMGGTVLYIAVFLWVVAGVNAGLHENA